MLPTSVLLGTRHAWVKENSNSHCVPADFCLSTLGLLGEITDTTFDEFIYHLLAMAILSAQARCWGHNGKQVRASILPGISNQKHL